MSLGAVFGRIEAALSFCGLLLMICALGADLMWRAGVGESFFNASELAVTGMLVMALFGIGVAAHAGLHPQPWLCSVMPGRWQRRVATLGYYVTSAFFLGLFALAVYTCVESQVLGSLTRLSGLSLCLCTQLLPLLAVCV